MSSDLKNKLLHLEAMPPRQSWEVIAAELDNNAIDLQIRKQLTALEVTPPPSVFSNLFTALQKTEPAPYAAALYQMEIPPPANAWVNIKNNLDRPKSAMPSFAPFIKYAAAAVTVGVIFWGTIQYLNTRNTEKPTIASATNPVVKPSTTTKNDNTTTLTNPTPLTEEARNDAALEASKKVYAAVNVAALAKKVNYTNDPSHTIPDIDPSLSVQPRGLGDMYETADDQLASTDKYIVLMTPDGKIIRMSKKLGNMVCCVSGEEQDEDCVDQMSKWRKQIAEHPKALSPGNFLDIVSLVNALQED
ncbi:MAG: hypothetical protein RIR12_1859 [Bacteroidota bacterium]|jgi:hypothetical protein